MRPNWAKGYNLNPDRLAVLVYESGFILGQSKLGDKLGADGSGNAIDATFNSIQFSENSSVETGLFVEKDVTYCTLQATLPEYLDLMGKRVEVAYGTDTLFKGTVREVNWTESLNGGKYWLPGNTESKQYDVTLTITAGDEEFSEAMTPPKNFSATQVEERVGQWLGLTTDASLQDPSDDLGRDLYDNVMNFISDYVVINASDDMGSLADTLRNALKLTNMHYVYKPWDGIVEVKNNNRWHSSDDGLESGSLMFTDDPADDTGVVLLVDGFLHAGQNVMYSSREFGYEPSYFQGSVKIQTNFGGEEVFGPYRANEVNPSDTVIDLGVQWIDGGDALPRNYVSTLPLKRSSETFTKSITVPMQSTMQLGGQVPGMALLKHDGITEKVAVLGVTHNITPHLWTVTYTLGPHHLLDRQGDYDPSLPKAFRFVDDGAGTGTVRFAFFTPETRPSDVNLYAYVYTKFGGNGNEISWSNDIVVRKVVGIDSFGDLQPMPTSVSYYSTPRPTTPGVYDYYVAITSDPNPGSGVVNHSYRQSQPQFIGTVVVT